MYKLHNFSSGLLTPAIQMTAAASGSNGITVADDDDIDFGTGDFFIHWEGSLPDWTPAANTPLILKWAPNTGYFLAVRETGIINVRINGASYDATSAVSNIANDIKKITCSIVRETASSAGVVNFYANGNAVGSPVSISLGAPATVSSANAFYCSGNATTRTASNTILCIVGNFAPTAAEVLDLCTNGIPESWKWGSQTGLLPATLDFTSGWSATGTASITDADTISLPANNDSVRRSFSVTAGKKYLVRLVGSSTSIFRVSNFAQTVNIISSVASGAFDISLYVDLTSNGISFRNISGGATTIDFTTVQVYQVGATMALLPNSIPTSGSTAWDDSSGNTGGGTLPAAGATKVTIRR